MSFLEYVTVEVFLLQFTLTFPTSYKRKIKVKIFIWWRFWWRFNMLLTIGHQRLGKIAKVLLAS